MTNLLTIRDLHVRFDMPGGFIEAVSGVSFRIRPRSIVALVGESGSGKSVISQAILRILPKSARITAGEMRAIRGGRISIIFQEPMTSLSPLHTIGNQVSEALRLHRRVGAGEAAELAQDMLRLVGFPEPQRAYRSYPFELSGGLRQRAMIAMALVCRPALLIADEPTTALDVTIQAQILKLLLDLQRQLGMAVLLITHDLGVVANLAEEVLVLYRGMVMESGTLDDILQRPEHPCLKALLRAVRRFGMAPEERLSPIREIRSGEAPHLMAEKAKWPAAVDGPLLECRDLRKSFTNRRRGWFGAGAGGRLALDGVSLDIARGECLGLVGESGCGKTTLSKILLRAIPPDSGSLSFNDHGRRIDVLALKGEDLQRFRRQVQYIFQDPIGSLNPRMTVYDIIEEPLVIHGVGTPRSRREMVHELVALVGLEARHLRRYPHSFSGGQRQRIGIARALALRPELIICDEPVSALDVSIQAQILNLLKDLKQKLSLTYLFISHNLAVVDYIADRIAVMWAGRIVEIAPRNALFRNPIHPYTQTLVAAVPAPDPSRRLDFGRLTGPAARPASWPAPFCRDAAGPPRLIEIAPGHRVAVTAPPDAASAPGLAPA